MGDPCHDWPLTLSVCRWLCQYRIPVIVTKHWMIIPDDLLPQFEEFNAVFNTSISPLDTEPEREHRLNQFKRLKMAGIKSVLRIVSCQFGTTTTGRRLDKIQRQLFKQEPIIDNPLRISDSDGRVICGDIVTEKKKDFGRRFINVSIANKKTYIGRCYDCPDQCGASRGNR
jgi:hypothetical protein